MIATKPGEITSGRIKKLLTNNTRDSTVVETKMHLIVYALFAWKNIENGRGQSLLKLERPNMKLDRPTE